MHGILICGVFHSWLAFGEDTRWCQQSKPFGHIYQAVWCLASCPIHFKPGAKMDNNTVRVAVGLCLSSTLCHPHTCWHCGADVDNVLHTASVVRGVKGAIIFIVPSMTSSTKPSIQHAFHPGWSLQAWFVRTESIQTGGVLCSFLHFKSAKV